LFFGLDNYLRFYLFKNFLSKSSKPTSGYKILHFHSTLDLYFFSKIYDLSNYTILLTSHSPAPTHVEVYENFIAKGFDIKFAERKAAYQKQVDICAFSNADYLVFPCEGAVLPYRDFLNINKISSSIIRYVITSSAPLIPSVLPSDYKRKNNIPLDRKIISFIGRKNWIKGFDLFGEIMKRFEDDGRFFFLSAGSGSINLPAQSNYLDLGWTEDPASLVMASDLHIIPNRETFFDLGIIQSLSLNKPLITTKTGGNSWFFDRDVCIYFADLDNIDSFVNLILNDKVYDIGFKNRDFFNLYFDNKYFAINYLNLYRELGSV
jgi:glycosyltransferase involved in cell wall biosynthesis